MLTVGWLLLPIPGLLLAVARLLLSMLIVRWRWWVRLLPVPTLLLLSVLVLARRALMSLWSAVTALLAVLLVLALSLDWWWRRILIRDIRLSTAIAARSAILSRRLLAILRLLLLRSILPRTRSRVLLLLLLTVLSLS